MLRLRISCGVWGPASFLLSLLLRRVPLLLGSCELLETSHLTINNTEYKAAETNVRQPQVCR